MRGDERREPTLDSSAWLPGSEESWDRRGSSRERAALPWIASASFLGAFTLMAGGALFGWGLSWLGPGFILMGSTLAAIGRLAILDPLTVHRLGPYGHPPTPAGVRATGYTFLGGGALFAVAGVMLTIVQTLAT